jgi:hypothetical protein
MAAPDDEAVVEDGVLKVGSGERRRKKGEGGGRHPPLF